MLQNEAGTQIDSYTTDEEYNGIYVFNNLTPGKYKLLYKIDGFWEETKEVEVIANETSFINMRVTPTTMPQPTEEEEIPEVECYPHPEQDGDIVASKMYTFDKASEYSFNIPNLDNLTIRRILNRNSQYYVLAVDESKLPVINVYDSKFTFLKSMSTEGLVTKGYNDKDFPYILSDIAFTNDGSLIGTNATVIGKENNAYQTGDFYVYKWEATDGGDVKDATPQVLLSLPTNTSASLAAAGNNNSNMIANTICLNGNLADFKLYFDSHPGNWWAGWDSQRLLCWEVKAGTLVGTQYNDVDISTDVLGEDTRLEVSPIAIDRVIYDSKNVLPHEFGIDWTSNNAIDHGSLADVGVTPQSNNAHYFRYADKLYMVAPNVYMNDATESAAFKLIDITNGLDKATEIGQMPIDTWPTDGAKFVTTFANVRNQQIDLSMIKNKSAILYTTETGSIASDVARVYAYDLSVDEKADSYEFKFKLNSDANVKLILSESVYGYKIDPVEAGARAAGENTITVNKSDIPSGKSFNWAIEASGDNVTSFKRIETSGETYEFSSPYGVAQDKNPENDTFGRVYVTNTSTGNTASRSTKHGLYVLGADGSDVTSQGANPYTGDITWAGTDGQTMRKVAVAEDGRVFVCDATTTQSGIYFVNPTTFAIESLFPGAVNSSGSLKIGGTYVGGQTLAIGVRGSGEKTQLFGVDKTASGYSWKKTINRYDIGENNTWTKAPSLAKVPSSYIGNDNCSIVPTEGGFWAAQYRGAGSNSTANPSAFYFNDKVSDAAFNTAEPNIFSDRASQNGALSVNEKESYVALSVESGVSILKYKMDKDGNPTAIEKFNKNLGLGATLNDFEFDYAGNLYVVSKSGANLSLWAVPTDNNVCTTPAKSTSIISGGSSVDTPNVDSAIKVYPNPTNGVVNVCYNEAIESIAVYSTTGTMVAMISGNGDVAQTINISDLLGGIYYIKINGKTTVSVIKK